MKQSTLATALVRATCTLTAVYILGCSSLTNQSSVEHAEQLVQESRYADAIEAYRRHIEYRINASGRPEWENPHFYLLRIADLQLQMSQPNEALSTCIEAEKRGVDTALLSDRYRAIAAWHIEHQNLHTAFELLKEHRGRDPLLFDAMLDRVGRELTTLEIPKHPSAP